MDAFDQQRVAERATQGVALGGLLVLSTFQILAWLLPGRLAMQTTDYVGLATCSAVLAASLGGRNRLAAYTMVTMGWVMVTWAVVADGGLRSVNAVSYLPVLGLMTLVGRVKAAWWGSLAFIALLLGLAVIELAGGLSPTPTPDPLALTARIIGSVFILGVVLWWELLSTERIQQKGTRVRERAAAQAEVVQEKRALVDEVVASLPGAIWISDAALGKTAWLSPTWEKILGYEPDPGTSVAALLSHDGVIPDRLEVRREDGSPRYLRQHTAALDEGRVIGMVVDETPNRLREQALLAQELVAERARHLQSIGQLAGEAAHDTNNVLTVALSMARLAREGLPKGHPATEELINIENLCTRTGQRMHQLMAFARQNPEEIGRVCVAEVVGRVEGLLRLLLPESVRLSISLAEGAFPIVGAPGLLEQALVGLVDDAAGSASRIAITVHREDRSIVLSIAPANPKSIEEILAPFLATCESPQLKMEGPSASLLLVEHR